MKIIKIVIACALVCNTVVYGAGKEVKKQVEQTETKRAAQTETKKAAETKRAAECAVRDGALDKSFGENGMVVITSDILIKSLGFTTGGIRELYSIALQPDGKIIVGATGWFNNKGVELIGRLTSNGQADGWIMIPFSEGMGMGNRSVIVRPDGGFIVGGSSDWGNERKSMIIQYTSNGKLDQHFGNAGIVEFSSFRLSNLSLQANGDLIVAGDGRYEWVLQRYKVNGTLDNNFGTNGTVVTSARESTKALAVQQDGAILVAGALWHSMAGDDPSRWIIKRYTSQGVLDTSFGIDGTATIPVSAKRDSGLLTSLKLQSDGAMIVGGGDWGLRRCTSKGQIDTSFGENGLGQVSKSLENGTIDSLAVQQDGAIVVGGSSNNDWVMARYTSQGKLDANFGNKGIVISSFGDRPKFGRRNTQQYYSHVDSLVLQPDGAIIAGGKVVTYSDNNQSNRKDYWIIRRYINHTQEIRAAAKGGCTATKEDEKAGPVLASTGIRSIIADYLIGEGVGKVPETAQTVALGAGDAKLSAEHKRAAADASAMDTTGDETASTGAGGAGSGSGTLLRQSYSAEATKDTGYEWQGGLGLGGAGSSSGSAGSGSGSGSSSNRSAGAGAGSGSAAGSAAPSTARKRSRSPLSAAQQSQPKRKKTELISTPGAPAAAPTTAVPMQLEPQMPEVD